MRSGKDRAASLQDLNSNEEDMAQKAALTAEEFGALPDQITLKKAEAYTERDGSYVLNVEKAGGVELADVSGLRSATDKQKREIDRLKAANKETADKLEELKDLAENPAAARNALEMIKNPDKATAERLKILEDELRTKAENQIKQFTKTKDDELAKVMKALEDEKSARLKSHHEGLVSRVISESGVKPKAGRSFVNDLIRTERQEDGTLLSYVIGEDGQPVMKKGVLSTQYADPVEHVRSLRNNADYASLFEPNKAGGSGAGTVQSNGKTTGAGIDPAQIQTMSFAEYDARRNAGEKIAGPVSGT